MRWGGPLCGSRAAPPSAWTPVPGCGWSRPRSWRWSGVRSTWTPGRCWVPTGAIARSGRSGARGADPLGTARDVGTRFAVRLLEESERAGPRRCQVRVRSGAVVVERTGR